MEEMRKRLNRQWAEGRMAYETYRANTEGLTYDGRDTCAWEDLATRVQDAWIATVAAVRREVLDGDCACIVQADATGAIVMDEKCEEHA